MNEALQRMFRQHFGNPTDTDRRYAEALAPIPVRPFACTETHLCASCGSVEVAFAGDVCSDGCADEAADDAEADRRLSLQRETEV